MLLQDVQSHEEQVQDLEQLVLFVTNEACGFSKWFYSGVFVSEKYAAASW